MIVRELVAGEVVRVGETQTLREAVRMMHGSDIGALAVETDSRLIGAITEPPGR
jgi:CBS domain-containing protein